MPYQKTLAGETIKITSLSCRHDWKNLAEHYGYFKARCKKCSFVTFIISRLTREERYKTINTLKNQRFLGHRKAKSFSSELRGGVTRMGEKEEWEKQESEMWIPEKEEEELVGEVKEIIEGAFGLQYLIATKEGKDIRTPSHKVLQSRMTTVSKEDTVKIVFKGEEPAKVKGQNPTKMYEVFKKK